MHRSSESLLVQGAKTNLYEALNRIVKQRKTDSAPELVEAQYSLESAINELVHAEQNILRLDARNEAVGLI